MFVCIHNKWDKLVVGVLVYFLVYYHVMVDPKLKCRYRNQGSCSKCYDGTPSSIIATSGTKDFGHYTGVATNQGFYKYYFNAAGTKVSGH